MGRNVDRLLLILRTLSLKTPSSCVLDDTFKMVRSYSVQHVKEVVSVNLPSFAELVWEESHYFGVVLIMGVESLNTNLRVPWYCDHVYFSLRQQRFLLCEDVPKKIFPYVVDGR